MTLFPANPKDGEIYAANNGKNYVYQGEKNVWQSTDCVPKWSDQVFIRGVENQTQQNVNDTNREVNVKVGNVATATNQLLDVAFDVRCRGIWIYQGGAVAPGDPPVGLQRFLMTDADGNKTQEYSDAVSLTVHAMGSGQMDKVSIGETQVGDLITIQNTRDLGGGSYIVTAIEEFGSDNPDELTETYAIYTVTPDPKRCSGNVATEEKAVLRIIPQQAVPALEDEYLPLTGGTMTGALECARPGTGNLYLLSCKAEGLPDGKQVAFRVTADGGVKAGHDANSPFLATAKNDVVTKAYTEAHTLQPDKSNNITTGFRIKCNNQTFLSASGGELGLYHLKEPTDVTHAATKGYCDELVQSAIDESATSERFYKIQRTNQCKYKSVSFYESNGLFYYYIDVEPNQGRIIGTPTNFSFKDVALPFKIGWIQDDGSEIVIVSAVATQVRKTEAGYGHFFQVAVDPTRADSIIHDPNSAPELSTVVVMLAGLM